MRGRVWFWVAATRVLARLAWQEPAAWAAWELGCWRSAHSISTTGDLASGAGGNVLPDPNGVVPTLALSVVAILSVAAIIHGAYGAVRFGLRDAMSRLAVPLCVAWRAPASGLYRPQAYEDPFCGRGAGVDDRLRGVGFGAGGCGVGCGRWRVVVALGAVGCAAVGVTIGDRKHPFVAGASL